MKKEFTRNHSLDNAEVDSLAIIVLITLLVRVRVNFVQRKSSRAGCRVCTLEAGCEVVWTSPVMDDILVVWFLCVCVKSVSKLALLSQSTDTVYSLALRKTLKNFGVL